MNPNSKTAHDSSPSPLHFLLLDTTRPSQPTTRLHSSNARQKLMRMLNKLSQEKSFAQSLQMSWWLCMDEGILENSPTWKNARNRPGEEKLVIKLIGLETAYPILETVVTASQAWWSKVNWPLRSFWTGNWKISAIVTVKTKVTLHGLIIFLIGSNENSEKRKFWKISPNDVGGES